MSCDIEKISNHIKDNILNKLEFHGDISDEELEEFIAQEISEYSKNRYINLPERVEIGKKILFSMRRLDVLQNLLDNPNVTEVMVNGYDTIFVEVEGRLVRVQERFESEQRFRDIIQKIVAECNRVVNDSSPIVDARLKDGSRVNVVLNPIAINGPILTIRRFPKQPYTMEQLIGIGSIEAEQAHFLKKLVMAGYNIIISGGTGSGKTTMLNILSSFIPKDERIITIEDSAELQIQGIDNLVRLETKNANLGGLQAITIRDLVKTSLRMRPNRIIVGEVRGKEAMDMICSAMNCGHDGSMSTVHANSAKDALLRLETMILMAVDIPLQAIRQQLCSGVDIIIHLGRMRDRRRRVLEIVELDRISGSEISVNTLYRFEENDQSTLDRVCGNMRKVGELIHDEKLKAAGIRL